jgi:hypothetical protein
MSGWASGRAVINTPYHIGRMTWAQLIALGLGSSDAGLEVFCTDYPGPTAGAKLYWTGSRWRPFGSRVLLQYINGAGLTVADGASRFILGGTIVQGGRGMIIPGDSIQLNIKYDKTTSSSGSADLEFREATTASILTGNVMLGFYNQSLSSYKYTISVVAEVTSNTSLFGQGVSSSNVGTVQTGFDFARYTVHDLSANDLYFGLTFVENTGGTCTIYKAQAIVNYV